MSKDIHNKALHLLSIREHSRLQLQQKLQRYDYAKQDIVECLDQLEQENWLSDARFCEIFFRSRVAAGYGPYRIHLELQHHGVAEKLIHAAEQKLQAEEQLDWQAQLQQVWQKKYRGVAADTLAKKQKQIRFLQQRGFPLEDVLELFE